MILKAYALCPVFPERDSNVIELYPCTLQCHIAGCKAEFRKHRLLKEHKLEVHSQGAKYL
ncbi:hypothetical protein DPMN_114602 [Dreissena polymorpha]|uniref:C2H2-type domain-containing protein n=1 Tax=Dreissena polymorpha TaxID=45954 RepID=A0A9D4KKH2_DREPO|nr:hypothetical protein DPMN_114602 [Dreissena polymorpha]